MTYVEMAEDDQIKQDISEMKKSLSTIEEILRGDKRLDEPSGIVYNVSENTKFRKMTSKIIWVLFTANAGLIVHYILTLFNRG